MDGPADSDELWDRGTLSRHSFSPPVHFFPIIAAVFKRHSPDTPNPSKFIGRFPNLARRRRRVNPGLFLEIAAVFNLHSQTLADFTSTRHEDENLQLDFTTNSKFLLLLAKRRIESANINGQVLPPSRICV